MLCIVGTFCTVDKLTWFTLLTLLALLSLFISLKLFYAAKTCSPMYILRQGANELSSKMLGDWSG